MITIRIPKDIREYREKIVFGLTIRQLICGFLALGIAVPLYYFGSKYIHQELISWIVILTVVPICAIGFVKIHKMPFEKYLVHLFYQLFLIPVNRVFKSENDYREWIIAYNKENICDSAEVIDKTGIQMSIERAVLINEELNAGNDVDFTKLDEKLITVKKKETKKKNGKDKNAKSKEKPNSSFNKLKTKAEGIQAKQTEDPKYIFNKKERKILTNYAERVRRNRLAEIKREKAILSKTNTKMKKRRTAASTVPRTVQLSIPFIADYDDGLFETEPNKYNKLYLFSGFKLLCSPYGRARIHFCKVP
ncbi:MAG: PrgI family protein [Oscillospiraceae bacterium]|nr:PrgI family protein [Oscillospiraceae bacterium]